MTGVPAEPLVRRILERAPAPALPNVRLLVGRPVEPALFELPAPPIRPRGGRQVLGRRACGDARLSPELFACPPQRRDAQCARSPGSLRRDAAPAHGASVLRLFALGQIPGEETEGVRETRICLLALCVLKSLASSSFRRVILRRAPMLGNPITLSPDRAARCFSTDSRSSGGIARGPYAPDVA